MSSRSILRNTAVVAVLTALSRMLGLVREMFQSRLIGAGVEQSAFAVAFALPNMKHMRKTSAAIQTMLRMLGMRAAAAKRPKAFSTPIPNAAAQMKSM